MFFPNLIGECLQIINLTLQVTVLIGYPAGCDQNLLVSCQTAFDETANMLRALPRRNKGLKPMGHCVGYGNCDSHIGIMFCNL